jgi:aspartate/methionine/tyrosine aminotransferase
MSFDDIAPPELLRERAFNLRWAQQPAGVIPLTAADSDFPVAPQIREAMARYVHDGVLGYGPPEGLAHFRDAVARWLTQRCGLSCTGGDVIATDSAAAAIAQVAGACLTAGDEVLIPDPVDFLFAHTISKAGATPVRVPLRPETTAAEYVAALQERVSTCTRMMWLCHPHNPLGLVKDPAWLRPVAEWAVARGLWILSDEVWSDIVYPPHRIVSVAALSQEIAARTVTVYGFSKGFGLAGLRIGAIVCTDAQRLEQIVSSADVRSTVAGASVLSQVGAAAAVTSAGSWLDGFLRHLRDQRDYALARLAAWPTVTAAVPQGTFVVFPNVSGLSQNTEELCAMLLRRAGVALVPGTPRWFGPGAAGHLRISFATSRQVLAEAFDRLDPVIAEIAEIAERSVRAHRGRSSV